VKELLRLARITHSMRSPLLFSSYRDSMFISSGDSFYCSSNFRTNDSRPRSVSIQSGTTAGKEATDDDISIRWYRHLLNTFSRDYVEYMKSLGLNVVFQTDPEKHEGPHPQFLVSDTLSIPTKKIYMVKVKFFFLVPSNILPHFKFQIKMKIK